MKKFLAGAAFGAVVSWTVDSYIQSMKVLEQYNAEMTALFNSIPEEQRFGYSKDFPDNQQWHL